MTTHFDPGRPRDMLGKPDALDLFGQHLIGLLITFQTTGDQQEGRPAQFRAYAGTLIQIEDAVFYLTAGHILRELSEALHNDQVQIERAVLADIFGMNRVCNHPIPFDLKSAPMFFVDDDEDGLDFGVIALRPYYIRLLAANGVIALGEQNWIHQSELTFEAHLMLGFPVEFTSECVSPSGDCALSPTMFGVQKLETTPEDLNKTTYPRFIGQLHRNLELKSVKGMSGGPIFGIKFGPPTRYWIVALQSTWIRDRHLVFGCQIPVLASLINKWAADAVERERGA
jgi:hypothetical protein